MGILGLYEVIEAFGYTKKDEFGDITHGNAQKMPDTMSVQASISPPPVMGSGQSKQATLRTLFSMRCPES